MMILALLRFLFCVMPAAFFTGLGWIFFDRQEITNTVFTIRRYRDKNHKEKILKNYLEECHKQTYKSDDNNKKDL